MSLWMWMLVSLALIKLPIAALMLWLPFRNDEAMRAENARDSSDEDGGSPALPAGPLDPRPRRPGPPRLRPSGSHGDALGARRPLRRGDRGCPQAPTRRRVPAR